MSSAPRFVPRYSVDDYRLSPGDWELIDGVPFAMSPSPFGPHQQTSLRLAGHLLQQIDRQNCGATVLQELDWVIDRHTVVRPDVILLCGPTPPRHMKSTPALIAEILSPSTAEHDRRFKRDIYEEQGVEHYLLLDPQAKQIQWLQRSQEGSYVERGPEREMQFSICDSCTVTIDRDAVFR